MTPSTRGLTLLELLLAIALLGALVLGTGWWVRESSRRARVTGEALQSDAAVVALLAAIERDVTLGDLALPTKHGPKVRVNAGSLLVMTRSATAGAGAVVREYMFRPSTAEILATERLVDSDSTRGAAPTQRVVLGGVEKFVPMVDGEAGTVTVELQAAGAQLFSRRWELP